MKVRLDEGAEKRTGPEPCVPREGEGKRQQGEPQASH